MLKAMSIPAIPRTVWMLGFVSLFMDMSSELVHCLLPVFLVSTLGASVMTVASSRVWPKQQPSFPRFSLVR